MKIIVGNSSFEEKKSQVKIVFLSFYSSICDALKDPEKNVFKWVLSYFFWSNTIFFFFYHSYNIVSPSYALKSGNVATIHRETGDSVVSFCHVT